MNNYIKNKALNFSLILCPIIFFANCKSVQITFLGLAKYSSTPNTKTSYQNRNKPIPENVVSIYGSVKDNYTNNPISNSYLTLADSLGKVITVAKTDSFGKYTFHNILPQKALLEIDVHGYKGEKKNIIITSSDKLDNDFSLTKLGSISGITVKADSVTPQSSIMIVAKGIDNHYFTSISDSSGVFILDELPDNTYTITANSETYFFSQETIGIKKGVEVKNVKLVCDPGKINGVIKVVNSANSIVSAKIILKKYDTENFILGMPINVMAHSNENGNFNIEGLKIGSYRIYIWVEGYGTLMRNITLTNQDKIHTENFVLYREGKVSGHILNYYSEETAVALIFSDDNKGIYKIDTLKLNPDGEYNIKGITPGIYRIAIKTKEGFISSPPVKVLSGKETTDVNFIIKKQNRSISGKIISESSNLPIQNALIIASSETSSNYAFSDKNGNYEVPGLSLARYLIEIFISKYKTASKSLLVDKNFNEVNFNISLK